MPEPKGRRRGTKMLLVTAGAALFLVVCWVLVVRQQRRRHRRGCHTHTHTYTPPPSHTDSRLHRAERAFQIVIMTEGRSIIAHRSFPFDATASFFVVTPLDHFFLKGREGCVGFGGTDFPDDNTNNLRREHYRIASTRGPDNHPSSKPTVRTRVGIGQGTTTTTH